MEHIKTVYALYFSPTGGTKRIVQTLAKEVAEKCNATFVELNITPPKMREKNLEFGVGDLVILGMPVIAGRVPNLLLPYLCKKIQGGGAFGVPVVSFGNRNFDDALVELRNIMEDMGYKTIAGGAFVSEHSFSKTLGEGRPDERDKVEIQTFGDLIVGKMKSDWVYEEAVFVAGNNPPKPYFTPRDRYGNPIDIRKVKPETADTCVGCGLCAEVCPLGSIDPEDPKIIKGICMKCCGCVKKCPEGSKYFADANFIYHKEELEEMYQRRAESAYFL